MNAAHASISLRRLSQISGFDKRTLRRLLRALGLLRRRRDGSVRLRYADLASWSPELYHAVTLVEDAVRRKPGRPRISAPRYRRKAEGPK